MEEDGAEAAGKHESMRDELIGREEAMRLLEVGEEQLQVLIDDGLLTPVGESGRERFSRAKVLAARQLGG
jgi:hypothetical protein